MDLAAQIERLAQILARNEALYRVIVQASGLGLKNYYIGAGCIAQTVWNDLSGLPLAHGISDIDFVYYDDSDLSSGAEAETVRRIAARIGPCGIKLDIKNEARVHLWYKEHFGYEIKPYESIEHAINTWPTTATAVGVRLEDSALKVYAPFGLDDLFGMIVRANKAQITEEIYLRKVQKWSAKWPELTIIPW
ncbi:MAG: nucleotidyltransferase family protein [Firmicutes bacterium]|nr:nucleotidyltransferase family protein [Bacillota bacterium]